MVDTWTSDAKEAHVIKRLVVGETYTLREEFAPYGYLKATDIKFKVEDTGKVQHVEMKDEVPTGSIVINKDGEFVTDTTLMKGYWYDFIFNFFKDSLAGVTFDVYAKEDIVSADGLDTVYHRAGDKVATIVTNDKGIARIDDLPLGKYYLVETKTIDGFVLDDTPIEADLSYIDQNTKGVPVQTIKEVMDKGEKPITMRRLYEEVLEQLNKVKKQIPEESEYVKALISQMDEVVEKINHQNERYDALNKKLSEIETSKDDEEVRARLVKENQDKDALINSQQNELNKASSTIARLRDDIEKKDKEIKRMGDRIESLEDKIISVATENKKEAESKAEPQESQSVPQAEKKMVDTVAVPQNMQAVANGIPVYYQIPVVDGTGNVVQRLPIERSVRKSSNNGVASLFARLSFKKKSRADIVKLVVSGDLVPAQLVQIKSAIEWR